MPDTQKKMQGLPHRIFDRGSKGRSVCVFAVFVCSTNVVLLDQKAFVTAGYRFNIREDT
jgi:hypothetical protein